jgi:RHS repeat-associated protein
VTALSNGNAYQYDPNGNMTQRNVAAGTYNLAYDAENHLVEVSGVVTATYVYNGDGERVLASTGITSTTAFIGNYFEWDVDSGTMKKYYYAGAVRVAMREGTGEPKWLLGDHLGSTSVVYDGVDVIRQGYMPWGERNFIDGASELPTSFRFTGQREAAEVGLYFYNARWYDPSISRFVQADTIVPGTENPQAFDRFAYAFNNPVNLNDPSGHCPTCEPLIDDEYSLEYAIEHADDIGQHPSSQNYKREVIFTDNPHYDQFAIKNGTSTKSTTIPVINEPHSPGYSYDVDPSGNPIQINYGKCIFCAINDLASIVRDMLGYYTEPESGTVTADLYYSIYSDGSVKISGIDVTNNTNVTVFVTTLDLNRSTTLGIDFILAPDQSKPISFSSQNYLADGFRIAKLEVYANIPEWGAMPYYVNYNSFDIYFE